MCYPSVIFQGECFQVAKNCSRLSARRRWQAVDLCTSNMPWMQMCKLQKPGKQRRRQFKTAAPLYLKVACFHFSSCDLHSNQSLLTTPGQQWKLTSLQSCFARLGFLFNQISCKVTENKASL